jgi:hypothetical protein
MEITLKVTVQVEPTDEDKGINPEDVKLSVVEGVWEALNNANNRGFNHPMADSICMNVSAVVCDKDS